MNNYFNFCDLFRYYKFDVILLESFELGGGGLRSFFITYFPCKNSRKVYNLLCGKSTLRNNFFQTQIFKWRWKTRILSSITKIRLPKMKQYLPLSRCFKLTIEPNRRDSYHFMQIYIEKKTFLTIFGVLLNKHYKTG